MGFYPLGLPADSSRSRKYYGDDTVKPTRITGTAKIVAITREEALGADVLAHARGKPYV